MLTLLIATVFTAAPAPRVVHASIFKNGFAFVTREIPVTASGDIEIRTMPTSAVGTLWFGTTDGIKIKQITNSEVKRATSVSATSLADLLRLNLGHEVTITREHLPDISGNLKSVQEDLVVVEQGQTDQIIFKHQISGISSSAPLEVASAGNQTVRMLHVRLEAPRPGKLFYVSLERGLGWDSAYLAELKGGKLTLSSRATIVDELDDLDGVEVLLGTLSPGGGSIGVLDTLVADDVAKMFDSMSTWAGGQGLVGESIDFISYDPSDNSLVARSSGREALGGPGAPNESWAQATGAAGLKREDQYFYRQADVRLKKGDRAQFLLYEKEIPYRDVYSLDVSAPFNPGASIPPSTKETVYHKIKFTNLTGRPLTTAGVTTLADGQLLGRSMIEYAPIGTDVEYNLSAAPEIQADATEEEVNRTPKVTTFNKQSFGRITLKRTLSIDNTSAKQIHLRVSDAFFGEWIHASDNPEVHKAASTNEENPLTQLKWDLTLRPGAKQEITYQYRAYARD